MFITKCLNKHRNLVTAMESPEGDTAFTQWSNQDLQLQKATFLNFHPGGNRCYYFPFPPGIFILNLNFTQWKDLFLLKNSSH